MTETSRNALYEGRIKKLSLEVEALAARSARIGNLRGIAFLAAFGALIWGTAAHGGTPSIALGVLSIAGFVALVRAHALLSADETYAQRLLAVNQRAQLRVTGHARVLLDDGADLTEELAGKAGSPSAARQVRTLADDLDLFGRASLFQRISVAHTRFGRSALGQALVAEPDPPSIARRQAAIRALAAELELRQRVEALASALTKGKSGPTVAAALDPEPLLRWAESAPRLLQRPVLIWAARLLAAVNVGFVAAAWADQAPGFYLLGPLSLSLLVILATRRDTHAAFAAVATREGALSGYDKLLEAIETSTSDAELLEQLRQRLRQGDATPSRAMNQLRAAVSYFELRYQGLLYPFANLFLLWDVHCTVKLERWQERFGKGARDWFLVLGEFEGLSSLAGLSFDEPKFCFPSIASEPRLLAQGLGHPLIPAGARVGNDVTLPGAGSALLVTGSNMSGKSTLLRSMGVACVLAYAGGPVCASRFELGCLRVATSLRIRDSLEEGVSHFYAELHKLKAVLDATSEALPVLFLLDEILHGTNSLERQVGARWLLAQLLQRGALGAVSTHDMELCKLSAELMTRVRLVHLREDVQGQEMTFDYRLREGPVSEGNALRLMRRIGLDVPE
ncbi:MAG TPA: MutS family DNA mismatch repair protein [Polyangiaceae bacterium]|nr:MutS family DNA mismatch repair protein [Polyangiaceae bacterium]